MIKGLAPKTESVFNALSKLDIIKDYVLVGGTALSLQLQTRISEDLDFMMWKKTKNDKPELPWNKIEAEFKNLDLGKVNTDVLGFNQVLFEINKVKLSFYFRDSYAPEGLIAIPFMGSIQVADINSIGVMKIDAMLRRSLFRDYYDLYTILKQGADLEQLINKAAKYSGYAAKTKSISSFISNGSKRFIPDKKFKSLNPIYDVSKEEIEDFIIKRLENIKLFTEQEIPQSELAKLGLSLSDISPENKELLLIGKRTNDISLNIEEQKRKNVRLSLNRNADNSVNLVCHLS
jgi:Domain of unknown function (DUF1814).